MVKSPEGTCSQIYEGEYLVVQKKKKNLFYDNPMYLIKELSVLLGVFRE